MRSPTPVRLFVLILLLAPLAGCFSYVPRPLDVTPEGQRVRLLVSQERAPELRDNVRDVAGTSVSAVVGTHMGADGSDLLLRIPVAQRQEGIHLRSLDQMVRVPTSAVLQVEHRELDVPRTALLVGGAVGAGAFILLSIMDALDSQPGEGPGDQPESRIPVPLVSVPIGR